MYGLESGIENPHVHIYMATQTIDTTLRPHFRHLGAGNGFYSIKKLNEQYPIQYLAYILKEDLTYVQSGIPPEIIEEARLHDEKVKQDLKNKKKERKTQLEKVEEYAQSLNKDLPYFELSTWLLCTIQYYKTSGILFREFQVISISQTLFLKYNPDAVLRLENILRDKMKI